MTGKTCDMCSYARGRVPHAKDCPRRPENHEKAREARAAVRAAKQAPNELRERIIAHLNAEGPTKARLIVEGLWPAADPGIKAFPGLKDTPEVRELVGAAATMLHSLALRDALSDAHKLIIELVENGWIDPHDDGCPQDDTCECELVAEVNRVCAAAHEALHNGPVACRGCGNRLTTTGYCSHLCGAPRQGGEGA